jgi:hypothetical protein
MLVAIGTFHLKKMTDLQSKMKKNSKVSEFKNASSGNFFPTQAAEDKIHSLSATKAKFISVVRARIKTKTWL